MSKIHVLVLRRCPAYKDKPSGILFEKDVPAECDEGTAARLRELGQFQDVTDTFAVPDGIEVVSGGVPVPSNTLKDADLSGKSVLLKRMGGIGDVVFVATVAHHIKKRYPRSFVALAVRPNLVDFAAGFDAVHEVASIDHASKIDYIGRFDYIVHFNGVIEGNVEDSDWVDDRDYFEAHWRRAGFEEDPPAKFDPIGVNTLAENFEVACAADKALRECGIGEEPYVVLLPGSSNPLKRLHADRAGAIATALATSGEGGLRTRVLCLTGPKDCTVKVSDNLSSWISPVINAPLTVSAELIRRSSLAVGVDTGLTQFAAAIGVPTLTHWGPTDPALSMAHYAGFIRAFRSAAECSPCRRLRPSFCGAFSGMYPACMRTVPVDEIVAEAKAAWPGALSDGHPAKEIVPREVEVMTGERARARFDPNKVNVAILIDNGGKYTGGGFYAWQIAKLFAERAATDVWVVTDARLLVYAGDDSPRKNLHVVHHAKLGRSGPEWWDPWPPPEGSFQLVIGTPPALGEAAVEGARACGGKCALLLYETPNYIRLYRRGLDGEERYWERYKKALSGCDCVLAISRAVKDAFREWDGSFQNVSAETFTPPINSDVGGLVIGDEPLPVTDRNDSIVIISRNVAYKSLADALTVIVNGFAVPRGGWSKDRPFEVHVIGDGVDALAPAVQEVWADKGVRVRLHSNLPEREKWVLLSRAKVLVHPSQFEGFGIPLAEAMFAGAVTAAHPLPVFKDCFLDYPFYFTDGLSLVRALDAIWDASGKGAAELQRYATEGRALVKRKYTLSAARSHLPLLVTRQFGKTFEEAEARHAAAARSELGTRIGLVTSWGIRCGIGETTRAWTDRLNMSYRVFAPRERPKSLVVEDDVRVVRCWDRNFNSRAQLLNEILDFSPHVVHFEHEFSFYRNETVLLELMKELKSRGIKVVATLHTYYAVRLLDQIREIADRVVVTKPQEDFVGNNVVEIHLPVPDIVGDRRSVVDARRELNMDEPRTFIVGTFGLWNQHKGFDEVVATYGDVAVRAGGAVKYGVLGYRPPQNQYAQQVIRKYKKETEAGAVIFWQDYLPEDRVLLHLCACDVLVFNYSVTGHSSASAAIRTGMTAGRPIVCSTSPMFSEFEHERHVLKVPFGDQKGLADAILRLQRERDLRTSLVRACDEYVAGCLPDKIARAHEALYEGLLEGTGD